MVGSSLAPKWPIVVSFYGIHHQKSNFLLILAPFLPEAVEANRCYFFENWVKKLKCPHLLKPLGTIFQHNYWSFYTSEPFTLARFNMRHPVVGIVYKIFISVYSYFEPLSILAKVYVCNFLEKKPSPFGRRLKKIPTIWWNRFWRYSQCYFHPTLIH